MSEAAGFLEYLDDDLQLEKVMGRLSKRGSVTGGTAVGFLDLLDEAKQSSPTIERVISKKKAAALESVKAAKGFLDVGQDLDLSFPDTTLTVQTFKNLADYGKAEWEATLLCFRAVCKPIDMLHVWAKKYDELKKAVPADKFESVSTAMVDRLKTWKSLYPNDFTTELVDQLREVWAFVVERPTHFTEDLNMKELVLTPLSPRRGSSEGKRATSDNESAASVGLLDLNPIDIARVLTIDEFELFAEVPIIEFVAKGGWAPKSEKTPAVDRLSERFNKISRWVTTTVVCADDTLKLDILLKWIVVAYQCKRMNNFNTMMEILSGLNQSSVGILKTLWQAVPPKMMKKWEEMNLLSDPLGNFRNYRRELKAKAMLENRKKVPVMPYIPVFLRDVLFFNEGNQKPDMSVMVQFWSTVEQIRRFQSLPFSFTIDPKTAGYVVNNLVLKDEEELFEIASKSRPTVSSESFKPYQNMDFDQ